MRTCQFQTLAPGQDLALAQTPQIQTRAKTLVTRRTMRKVNTSTQML